MKKDKGGRKKKDPMAHDRKIPINPYRPPGEFQGWFAPAFMADMFEARQLSCFDVILLCALDSFVEPVTNCRGTDQEFADYMGKGTPEQIGAKFRKFEEMGLISIKTLPDGGREMKTIWFPSLGEELR